MVLKSDVLGRIRTPGERRRSLLEEFDRSGLSGVKFAALAGVKYSTFASWLHLRRHRRGGPEETKSTEGAHQMRWLETVIEQAQSPADKAQSALVMELPGGARIQIGTRNQAALAVVLLRELEKPVVAC